MRCKQRETWEKCDHRHDRSRLESVRTLRQRAVELYGHTAHSQRYRGATEASESSVSRVPSVRRGIAPHLGMNSTDGVFSRHQNDLPSVPGSRISLCARAASASGISFPDHGPQRSILDPAYNPA